MDLRWWDESHASLGRMADCAELLELRDRARQTARQTLPPLLTPARSTPGWKSGWTEEKAAVLRALDAQGMTAILTDARHGLTLPLALAVAELASVDGGAATCSLSGSLAQMPIRDYGTALQRARYLGRAEMRHGALCLTEPLPGAGAEAISLAGRMALAGWGADGEPLLELHKRGRFTSHMDFAEFVLAAVEGDGHGVRGSGLVILEPGDAEPDNAGDFERGASVRKLGHRLASTTDPVFRLRVPAARLVGGYTMEEGVLVPRFSHRALLEPALRRMRALLGIMTAAKALATVQECSASAGQKSAEFRLDLADLWATGEAAASLGFCAARLSDSLDGEEPRPSADAKLAALFSPAAKLYSGSRVAESLRQVAAWSECGTPATLDAHARMMDVQIEEMYMGPAALQRRLVSAAMTDTRFLADFQTWTGEMEALAARLPRVGVRSLAAGMRLWRWTLERLRERVDAQGFKLYGDARQGVTFAMADALCELLAARSLALDVVEMDGPVRGGRDGNDFSIFRPLSTLALGRGAARVAQICAGVLCGYAPRFPLSDGEQQAFAELRKNLCFSLRGTMDAREEIAEFLRAG